MSLSFLLAFSESQGMKQKKRRLQTIDETEETAAANGKMGKENKMNMKTVPTIAGSDCSGGAGIQADLKTMIMNGVYGMSVITAMTAQNTTGVRAIQESTPEFLKQQIDAVFEDIYPLDNLSYTSYMLRVAYEEGEAEVLTAVLACAYSYEVIAKRILQNNPDSVNHPFYGDWIKGYASDEYVAGNVILLDTLNRLASQYTEPQIQHLIDIFVVCSRYEMTFWEMSWKSDGASRP